MSRSRSSSTTFWVCLAGFLALTSGCSSGSSLALSTSASPAGETDSGVLPDAGATSDGGISLCGRLMVDRVRLVVRRIDLEKSPSAADGGSDAGMDAGQGDAGADAGHASC